ncbi:transposase [Mucilaginibacter sp. Mucisp86]|uniref:REP-associated tyrosine transposase n=1 Tax=Mucilaginibacter sp. Mucisp86 TaxID=3243060 RepID=UPI0039B6A1B1
MATHTLHNDQGETWFITFTCYNWIPLFEITQSYNILYGWLKFIAERYQVQTHAFVLMPNHVHLIHKMPDTEVDLNKIISNGKRFMAYELVKKPTELGKTDILDQLSAACTEKEKAKGQKHKVFEPSFDAKPIYSTAFLHQKLDYIHHNPVSGRWSLCNDFTKYPYSSATFYYSARLHESIPITDYRDFWTDMNHVKPVGF